MKSSLRNLLVISFTIFISPGCSLLNKTKIKSGIKFSKKNIDLIKECSKFAIEYTLDRSKKSFSTSEIGDKSMRSKIGSLGQSVTINFTDVSSGILDSVVTFKTMTFFYGVHEIIYDFAYNQRKFENEGSNKETYYFTQVADRVYFRRRELPLM